MAPSNPEHEDTHVINPLPTSFHPDDDDNVQTREYRRPSFARPAPWTTAEPAPSKTARRRSKHTITKTVPALRHMVGMPVMPSFAPAGLPSPHVPHAAAISAPAPSVKLPRPRRTHKSKSSRSRHRALAAALAFAATAIALIGAVLGFLPTATRGSVLVTAYGVSGLPDEGFKVIANGDTLCQDVPCRFELDPGEHWVTVVAPGYERPSSRRVFVGERSESNLHFELVPSAE